MSTTPGEPWVVVLGSHLQYHSSAAWLVPEGEEVAKEFAAWVTKEIDPAQAMPLRSPTTEVLGWCAGVLPQIIEDLKKPLEDPGFSPGWKTAEEGFAGKAVQIETDGGIWVAPLGTPPEDWQKWTRVGRGNPA